MNLKTVFKIFKNKKKQINVFKDKLSKTANLMEIIDIRKKTQKKSL